MKRPTGVSSLCGVIVGTDVLKAWRGQQTVCVDGDGARYWMLIYRLVGVDEEIKAPAIAGA